jgi:hypothetical protein
MQCRAAGSHPILDGFICYLDFVDVSGYGIDLSCPAALHFRFFDQLTLVLVKPMAERKHSNRRLASLLRKEDGILRVALTDFASH